MSYVIAAPEMMQGAVQDLAGIRASLTEASAAAGPTTGLAAAAADEVSIAIASLFSSAGQQFQVLNAQALAFHAEFESLLSAGAAAYVSAEAANAAQLLSNAVNGISAIADGGEAAVAALPAAKVSAFDLLGGILNPPIGSADVGVPITAPGRLLPAVNIPPLNLSAFSLPQIAVPPINIPPFTTPAIGVGAFSLPQISEPGFTIPPVGIAGFSLPDSFIPNITIGPLTLAQLHIPLPGQLTAAAAGVAAVDPITALGNVLGAAQTNTASLFSSFAGAPFPTLQQLITNPASIMNLQGAANAAVTAFLPTGPSFLSPSITGSEVTGWNLVLPEMEQTNPAAVPLLEFLASPVSGVLWGTVGWMLEPALALQNSFHHFLADAFVAQNPTAALYDLLNVPANVADATLNAQFIYPADGGSPDEVLPHISLDPLTPYINSWLPEPPGVTRTGFDLFVGGLLSPGGSVFNALGPNLLINLPDGSTMYVDEPGNPVGPIGSAIELDQAIATGLGFNFNTVPLGLAATPPNPATNLLGNLTAMLGDLPTTISGSLSTQLSALSTDVLGNL